MGGLLAACQETRTTTSARAYAPIPSNVLALMQEKGTDAHKPILIRTFKKEAEFEIWKQRADGQYTLLKTYPMCRWSGQLGPKIKEGDRQVPEGFYTITPGQMNPNSAYYLSFNVGYPNAYDRAHGYSGGSIMVHGACSSAGCFSMTDEQIAEIYAVAREAFGGGQRAIQMQSLPFRMTAENLAKHRLDPNIKFWKELKDGSDQFEVSKQETKVSICARRYVFGATAADGRTVRDGEAACPPMQEDKQLAALVAEKQKQDDAKVAELVASGVKPVRIVYADGGQNPEFAYKVNELSRPEAIEQGPREIVLDDKGRPLVPPAVQLAATRPEPVKPQAKAEGVTFVPAASPAAQAQAQAQPLYKQLLGFSDPAPASQPVAAAPAPVVEDQPFYKRFLWSSDPAPVAPSASEPDPAARPIPLPPRRQATVPAASPKPQASLSPPEPVSGAAPVLAPGFKALAALER
jgi:murein L,D-transpeptidase YafK